MSKKIKDICKQCENNNSCKDPVACKKSINKIIYHAMIDECEGFYRTFKKLEGLVFLKTDISEIGLYYFKERDKLHVPCIINGALAIEIAIKAVLYKENLNFTNNHKILDLFEKLPESEKRSIKKNLKEKYNLSDEDISHNIAEISNCFVEWRYSYEYIDISITIFLKQLADVICPYVIGKYNEI